MHKRYFQPAAETRNVSNKRNMAWVRN